MEKGRAIAWLVLVTVVVAVALTMAFGASNEGKLGFFVWAGAPYVALAIAASIRAAKKGDLGQWLRPQWGDITRGFVAGGVLFAAAFAFVKLVVPQGSPREAWMARIYLQVGDPGDLRAHMAAVAVGILVVSAAEEIVWRGLVQDVLAELAGPRHAWIGSALLYAVAHAGTAFALKDTAAGPNPMICLLYTSPSPRDCG